MPPHLKFHKPAKYRRLLKERRAATRAALPGQAAFVAFILLASIIVVFLVKSASDGKTRIPKDASASAPVDCRGATLCR